MTNTIVVTVMDDNGVMLEAVRLDVAGLANHSLNIEDEHGETQAAQAVWQSIANGLRSIHLAVDVAVRSKRSDIEAEKAS